jgi:hypothetical protein
MNPRPGKGMKEEKRENNERPSKLIKRRGVRERGVYDMTVGGH